MSMNVVSNSVYLETSLKVSRGGNSAHTNKLLTKVAQASATLCMSQGYPLTVMRA